MREDSPKRIGTCRVQLTPNSLAVVWRVCDNSNDSFFVQFLANDVPYWTTLVSAGNASQTLRKKCGNSVVTFRKRLKVNMLAQGSIMTLFASGKINDSGTVYTLIGKLIYRAE